MLPAGPSRAPRAAAVLAAAGLFLAPAAAALDPSRAVTQYHRQVWTAQQALPHNSVNWLAQDAAGYLLVGTFGGSVLFDGFRFQPLAPQIGFDPTRYARTPEGVEWFVAPGHLARRDGARIVPGPAIDALGTIIEVQVDSDGSLLFAGSGGFGRLPRGPARSRSTRS